MAAEAGSLEKAFREVTSGAVVGVAADPAQLDLLRDEQGKLPADVFRRLRAEERGRGRPPGAGNRRNKKLAQLICEKHGDPVIFMASVYDMPLDQLVELLRIADNSHEREEQMNALSDRLEEHIKKMVDRGTVASKAEWQQIERVIDRLIDVSKMIQFKPGDLAAKALMIQLAAAKETGPYVHGKQPISVEVTSKADIVVFAPEILKQHGLDPDQVQAAIAKYGLEAFDPDTMTLQLPAPEEGEFEDVDSGEADDA
jgi:hypothetical protein